jgi:putative addiction module killer protein
MADNITVLDYTTEDGRNPFRQWLAKLRDIKAVARVQARLERLTVGNFGDARAVGKGVNELRIPYGPGYRVYFARNENKVVVLLCGGDKSSQSSDIRQAQAYWADFKRRML